MQEKELIEKSLQKDEIAFAQLMHLYQDKIYQHILSIVKDEMTAQDLSQDTFLQAYQKLNTFHGSSSFYTWVYRIAHNKSLNAIRLKHQRKEEVFDEAYMTISSQKSLEWDPEEIRKALNKLPMKQAEAFEKFYFQKMSQKEIASSLNVPLGTIRSRIFYAKKQLRILMQSE